MTPDTNWIEGQIHGFGCWYLPGVFDGAGLYEFDPPLLTDQGNPLLVTKFGGMATSTFVAAGDLGVRQATRGKDVPRSEWRGVIAHLLAIG